MSNSRARCLILALLLSCGPAGAAVEVTLPDGRTAILNDDFTWTYGDSAAPTETTSEETVEPLIRLTLEKRIPGRNSCTFGLRMHNGAPYEIKHLVPRFSAFTNGGIEFQTVYRSFESIRPLRDRYKQIKFTNITCDAIDYILVLGGDRCAMGDLDRYSPLQGECLKRVRVEESELTAIRKAQP